MKVKTGLTLLLSFIVALVIFTSCSEDEETGKDILISKTWAFDKLETDATDSLVIFFAEFVDALMTGATATFKDDGTFSQTAMGETGTGTWSLSDDENKITIASDSTSNVYDVMTLSESQFSYYEELTEENLAGENITYKLKYYWK